MAKIAVFALLMFVLAANAEAGVCMRQFTGSPEQTLIDSSIVGENHHVRLCTRPGCCGQSTKSQPACLKAP